MASHPEPRLTEAEYLQAERSSPVKHEFLAGRRVAMAGASPAHVLIVTNIAAELRAQLKGRDCTVYAMDLRIKVQPSSLYTYPGVSVVCGRLELAATSGDALLNPRVLVEVLSPSTASYDRGEKFEHYRRIPSFTEYLLVAQDRVHVEHYLRQADNRWLLDEAGALADVVTLESIACRLALAEIYDKVRFGE